MEQSLPDVDKAKGNGSHCREMTNRQERVSGPHTLVLVLTGLL